IAGKWQGTLTINLSVQQGSQPPAAGQPITRTYTIIFNNDGKPDTIPAIQLTNNQSGPGLDIATLPPVGQPKVDQINTIDGNGNGEIGTITTTVKKADFTDTTMEIQLETVQMATIKQDGCDFPSNATVEQVIKATVLDPHTMNFNNNSTFAGMGPTTTPPTCGATPDQSTPVDTFSLIFTADGNLT